VASPTVVSAEVSTVSACRTRADENGRPFDGAHDYAITFAADALPPVAAFWSITVYDAAGHLYANDLHRYGLGSRQVPR